MRVEREADSRPCKRNGVFISYFCITVSKYQTETCQRMVFILIHFQKDFFLYGRKGIVVGVLPSVLAGG